MHRCAMFTFTLNARKTQIILRILVFGFWCDNWVNVLKVTGDNKKTKTEKSEKKIVKQWHIRHTKWKAMQKLKISPNRCVGMRYRMPSKSKSHSEWQWMIGFWLFQCIGSMWIFFFVVISNGTSDKLWNGIHNKNKVYHFVGLSHVTCTAETLAWLTEKYDRKIYSLRINVTFNRHKERIGLAQCWMLNVFYY